MTAFIIGKKNRREKSILRVAALSMASMIFGFAAMFVSSSAQAGHPEIWLTPFAPVTSPDGRRGAADYFDLFKPDAAWPVAGAQVKVFKIYLDQLVLMSDEQVKTIVQGLAARNIALAMEANVLIETSVCAPGVGKAGPITPAVKRLKALGADLRYLAMNEPLWSGHSLPRPYYCQASIAEVAEDIAASLKPLYDIYPNLQVGDVEPIGRDGTITATWPDEIAQFIDAYRKASGRPLAFIHSDTVWGRDWQTDMKRLVQNAQTAKVPFGVIFDGDMSELSDAEWAEDTAHYAMIVEDKLGVHPDQVNFQVWYKWPHHTLPETDYSTMTGMVRNYLRSRTIITGSGRVQVTDDRNVPMPNVTLQVEVKDQNFGSSTSLQTLSGEVPAKAVSALLAMRVNAECVCPRAPVHFAMTGFQYAEQGTTGAFDQAKYSWDLHQWVSGTVVQSRLDSKAAIDVSDKPPDGMVKNGPAFPVHTGAQFQATFAWDVSLPSDGAGYISLIFLDAKGIETHRTFHFLAPTWRNTEMITTDINGYAEIPARYLKDKSGSLVAFSFKGDPDHRPGWLQWR